MYLAVFYLSFQLATSSSVRFEVREYGTYHVESIIKVDITPVRKKINYSILFKSESIEISLYALQISHL